GRRMGRSENLATWKLPQIVSTHALDEVCDDSLRSWQSLETDDRLNGPRLLKGGSLNETQRQSRPAYGHRIDHRRNDTRIRPDGRPAAARRAHAGSHASRGRETCRPPACRVRR